MSLVLVVLAAASTVAQETPVPAPTAKPPAVKQPSQANTVESVVVTGAAADVRTSVDRRSFTLGKDIAASTGSIGDALRNIPGVDVDLEGALTLRGDANVTIQIDGKPAGIFRGSGRADALQQLPADQIERVEVITNPSAAESSEGSGGIINLVTKKTRGTGKSGSVFLTAGTAGLKRLGGTFGYNSKKLAITGSLSGNYQRNKSYLDTLRQTPNAAGQFEDHLNHITGRNLTRGPTGSLKIDYDATPKDHVSGGVTRTQLLVHGYPFMRYEDDNAAGGLVDFQERRTYRVFVDSDTDLSAGWRHNFRGDGHELSIDLTQGRERYRDDNNRTIVRASPTTARPYELDASNGTLEQWDLKAGYARPLAPSAKLSLGYEGKEDENSFGSRIARGATAGGLIVDSSLGYEADYRQTVNALYAIYERPFGDLSLQAGLRLEDTDLTVRDRVGQMSAGQTYTGAYPSLHLNWKLDDSRKITAAYSKRVQRAPAFILIPSRVYVDPKNYQQGNPNLRPQETQSLEVAYERRKAGTYVLATFYYRQNRDEFSPVTHDLGDGVAVQTFDNLGSSRSAGLELTANGKLSSKLSYNANANLFWTKINAANIGFDGERSAYGTSGRVNLNWQATPKDLLQLNLSAQGKRLFAQGELQPSQTVNLGWRRKIDDRVTATLSVQDLLDSNRFDRRLDTDRLRDRYQARGVTRAVLLRLDYRFGGGGKPGAEPGFEYNGGAPGS